MTVFCSTCKNKINQGDIYCRGCGSKINIMDMSESTKYDDNEKKDGNSSHRLGIIHVVIFLVVIIVPTLLGMAALTPEARVVPVTVSYVESVQVPYTEKVQVPYEDPVYETRYYGTLSDTGLSTTTFTFDNAKSYNMQYTGKDLWGQEEYTFTIVDCQGKTQNIGSINAYSVKKKNELTGYITKYTTQIVTKYRTDYVTKYKTENKMITKQAIEWALGI
jgi:DNA-directed RNA polymerase subunit RPC12/RpoP